MGVDGTLSIDVLRFHLIIINPELNVNEGCYLHVH